MIGKLKRLLKKGNIIFLATSSKFAEPNLIAVESLGLNKNKLLIADCQFNKTLRNLKQNKKVSILVTNNKEYYQLKGKAEYSNKGKLFEEIRKTLKNSQYKPKGVMLMTIKEIWDLNKIKKLK